MFESRRLFMRSSNFDPRWPLSFFFLFYLLAVDLDWFVSSPKELSLSPSGLLHVFLVGIIFCKPFF